MNTAALDKQIRSDLQQSSLSSWVSFKDAADGRLVFTHIRQENDKSPEVSISYRPGPGLALRVELIVTEKMIDDANEGIDLFFYGMATLLEWLGGLLPDTAWAKAFPNDDALVVREPSGRTWEQPGVWKYCAG